MNRKDWKKRAEALFFMERFNIEEISDALSVSRKSVSAWLNTLPGYSQEVERRKAENAAKRRVYQRDWVRKSRYRQCMDITAESLKTEHETAVRILSRERYFK